MTHPLDPLGKLSPRKRAQIHTTLLDLVQAVNRVTEDDRLVVTTIAHLVNSGQVQFTGTFKGRKVIIE